VTHIKNVINTARNDRRGRQTAPIAWISQDLGDH
jgi:hypothetical protein